MKSLSSAQHWAHWEIIRVRVVICWSSNKQISAVKHWNANKFLVVFALASHARDTHITCVCPFYVDESMCAVVFAYACVIDSNVIKFRDRAKNKKKNSKKKPPYCCSLSRCPRTTATGDKIPILWFKLKSLSIIYNTHTYILSRIFVATTIFIRHFFRFLLFHSYEIISHYFQCAIPTISTRRWSFPCTHNRSVRSFKCDNSYRQKRKFLLAMWRFYCFLIWR